MNPPSKIFRIRCNYDSLIYGRALSRLDPLPETAHELREVARLLGAKPEDIKLGEDATVTDVKQSYQPDFG